MTHDPICPHDYTPYNDLWENSCICDYVATARADEREKAAQRVAALPFWSDWQEFVTRRNAVIAAARGEAQ